MCMQVPAAKKAALLSGYAPSEDTAHPLWSCNHAMHIYFPFASSFQIKLAAPRLTAVELCKAPNKVPS